MDASTLPSSQPNDSALDTGVCMWWKRWWARGLTVSVVNKNSYKEPQEVSNPPSTSGSMTCSTGFAGASFPRDSLACATPLDFCLGLRALVWALGTTPSWHGPLLFPGSSSPLLRPSHYALLDIGVQGLTKTCSQGRTLDTQEMKFWHLLIIIVKKYPVHFLDSGHIQRAPT